MKVHKKNKTKGKKQGLNHLVKRSEDETRGPVRLKEPEQAREGNFHRFQKPLTSFRNEEKLEKSSRNQLELNHLNSEQIDDNIFFHCKESIRPEDNIECVDWILQKAIGLFLYRQ